MNTLQKTIAILSPRERKRGMLVLLLVMGAALVETASVASVMPFLAVLGNPEMLESNSVLRTLYAQFQTFGVYTPDDFLTVLGIGAFLFIIVSAAYRTLTHYATNRYIEMRRHSIGSRMLEAYLRQPYAFFLNRHSGDMSKAILSEVDQLITNVFRPVYNMVSYSLMLVAIAALLVMIDPWLALFAAGLFGGLYVLIFLSLKQKLARLGGILVSANKERFTAVGNVFAGIKDIKLLGCEQSYLNRFEFPSQRFSAAEATYQTINQVPHFLIEAIIFGTILLLTVVLMINAGGLSNEALGQILPVLGLYAFAAYRMKPAVQNIYNGFASLRYGHAVVESLYTDLCQGNAQAKLPNTASAPLKAKYSIALQHVSFTYSKAANTALVDLDIEIPVGSALGLVGSTGSGKTTLVDILLGLLRPNQGAITVDGVPVSDAQLHAWQKSLGYVPQDIFLTDTSIAQNIAFGIPKEEIDQEQVERCARMSHVHDFIMRDLPAQYETLVGERGVRLSGGQRQRIGIARALYHNPEVLVFDEATSALDTVTEQAVMEAIGSLSHQKTIILIAHRLSTVKNCDQIVLLEQGAVKAKGTFNELMQQNVLFKRMAEQL